jgi:hypothetical protein
MPGRHHQQLGVERQHVGTTPLNCGIAVTATITSQSYNLSDNASCASFIQLTDKLNTAAGAT